MTGAEPLDWGATALWQQLEPLLPGLSVEVQASCPSTSTVLLDRIRGINPARRQDWRPPGPNPAGLGRRHSDVQPHLLVAEHQTQGRGRQGKAWQSAAGASLTFSLALPLAPDDWSGLSLAVGLALADALDPPRPGQPPRLGLKWPNDLLLLAPTAGAAGIGRKLGGILVETVQAGAQRMAVVGIGLNVQPQSLDGLSWGYGCLQELDPRLQAPTVLARVAPAVVQALLRFEAQGFAPSQAGFAARDVLFGRDLLTTLPDLPAGTADGVDSQGALWLRVGEQRLPVRSGEVSVRPAPGALGDPAGPAAPADHANATADTGRGAAAPC